MPESGVESPLNISSTFLVLQKKKKKKKKGILLNLKKKKKCCIKVQCSHHVTESVPKQKCGLFFPFCYENSIFKVLIAKHLLTGTKPVKHISCNELEPKSATPLDG